MAIQRKLQMQINEEWLKEELSKIHAALNRHDQTLYEFLVKPVRDEEDERSRKEKASEK